MKGPTLSRVQPWLVRAGTVVWVLLGVVLLAVAFQSRRARPAIARTPPPPRVDSALVRRYVPDYEFRKGREIVLVLVGAQFCGAHRKPGFAQAVEDAKLRVQDQAKARGAQFRVVAVSLDWDTDEALAFLDGFGAFDEVTVGSNWLNEGARRYIWNDHPGPPVVPQLLVIERSLEIEPEVQVSGERVLKRISGTDLVMEWVKAGASL